MEESGTTMLTNTFSSSSLFTTVQLTTGRGMPYKTGAHPTACASLHAPRAPHNALPTVV